MFLSVGQIVIMIVAFYKFFRDPDEQSEKNISLLKNNCDLKHKRIDEIFAEINKNIGKIEYTFTHFKENEFRHIEDEMRKLSDIQIKILTIMEEKK